MTLYPVVFLLGCVLYVTAFPEPGIIYPSENPGNVLRPPFSPSPFNPIDPPLINRPTYEPIHSPKFLRVRRFTDGNQRFDGQNPQQQKTPDWEVKPDLRRDDKGNTKGQVTVQKHGNDHDFEAGWGQTIRGPDKHSETWHVGGSVRW